MDEFLACAAAAVAALIWFVAIDVASSWLAILACAIVARRLGYRVERRPGGWHFDPPTR